MAKEVKNRDEKGTKKTHRIPVEVMHVLYILYLCIDFFGAEEIISPILSSPFYTCTQSIRGKKGCSVALE